MRGPRKEPDEPLLFDLPLDVSERPERPAPARKRAADRSPREERPAAGPTELSFFEDFEEESPPLRPAPVAVPGPTQLDEPEEQEDAAEILEASDGRAAVVSRFAAGGADLLVHAAVTVGILVGTRAMGVKPTLAEWPAVALFLVAFSFLYAVVPLAFWGHTLGMAWAGLTSRNRDGEPLTFDQTTRRWAGSLITLVTLGLPLLLARRGRALSDFLSGSDTYSTQAEG